MAPDDSRLLVADDAGKRAAPAKSNIGEVVAICPLFVVALYVFVRLT